MKTTIILLLLTGISGSALAENCSDGFKGVVAIQAASTPKDPCTVEWAEYILSHCDNGGYAGHPVCDEAKEMVVKHKGSIGEREELPNGWHTNRRIYK